MKQRFENSQFQLKLLYIGQLLMEFPNGAANQAEFTRQRTKILAALKAMNADIYALCEVGEGRTAVQDIVNGLNEAEGTDNMLI